MTTDTRQGKEEETSASHSNSLRIPSSQGFPETSEFLVTLPTLTSPCHEKEPIWVTLSPFSWASRNLAMRSQME